MKRNIALDAIALVLLLGAAFQSPNSVPRQLNAIQSQLSNLEAQNTSLAAQVASNAPRKFYLTKTTHAGDTALSACAMGYHMASLWEIRDPTTLRYNTDPSLSVNKGDSGSGPPAFAQGWIRTGNISKIGGVVAGEANCNAWTSASSLEGGTRVFLPTDWLPPTQGNSVPSVVDPWRGGVDSCNFAQPVWCVQD